MFFCLSKLQNGNLQRYICHEKHEWLHVPKWDDEEMRETRGGKVKFGGDLVNGKGVGYQVVSVQEWLELLREDWGLESSEGKSIHNSPPEVVLMYIEHNYLKFDSLRNERRTIIRLNIIAKFQLLQDPEPFLQTLVESSMTWILKIVMLR
jgi:hypothetical protein